jgi:hypothetical protein
MSSLQPFNDVFGGSSEPSITPSHRTQLFVDLIFLTLAVLAFCSNFLTVGSESRLPGLEADVFQALDWTLRKSLIQGSFPLWNPYIDTGLPFIADPMLHAYNPLVTIPVLLFGVWHGFKIAVALSFLFAAIGMYSLAASLGMSRVTRIWLALMFSFAGQPVARFFQGQYLFVLGFAWIPWIFLGYSQALLTRRRLAAALTAISAALLFFSGNAYYAFLMLICLGIFTLVWVITINKTRPYLKWNEDRLRLAVIIGIVSLLLISIQLLPTLDFLPFINKAADVQGFHNLAQIFLDLTSKDSSRADAFAMLPAREEFYAYIGYTPFLGLLAIPLVWRRHRRWVVSLLLILLFTVCWISLDRMPWYDWLVNQPTTQMFRHLLRALLFTSFAILLLGGLGFDQLFQQLKDWANSINITNWARWKRLVFKIPLLLLVGFMLYGVIDLYQTNRPILKPWDRPKKLYEVMAWLRRYDQDDIYVRHNPNNHGHDAILANDLRLLMPWYHYTEIRSMRGELRDYYRPLQIEPHYLVTRGTRWLPEFLDWTLIRIIEDMKVVAINESLPLAFTVKEELLIGGREQVPIGNSDVVEQALLWNGPNQSESIVKATDAELFVILVSYHPDWQVSVDGNRSETLNVSGVLGIQASPGLHKYTFSYRPPWFYIGLVLTSLGFLTVAYWLRDSLVSILSSTRRSIAGVPQQIRVILNRMSSKREGKVQIEPPDVGQAWGNWRNASGLLFHALLRSISWQSVLFILGVGVYIASRLIELENFPIFFFTDEAVQTVLAADFVRDGFHGYDGIFLPTYFENASLFNLSVSVYLQIDPYMLFGKSIFVTRAVPALVTATAVIALGLIFKRTFRLSYWWTAPFALGLIPTWFLHSRTAFETTLFVSFSTWAFYFYLEYRQEKPWNLLPAMLFGALGFYSYAGAQVVLGALGVLLLVVDWRYHRQHSRILFVGSLFAILLIYPYLRFRGVHATETYFHLRRLDSYWFHDVSPWTKGLTFLQQYFQGLNPFYWFSRYPDDLSRHLMRGYGRISLLALPFLLMGVVQTSQKFKRPENRTLILLMLTAPIGGALISVGITRVLLMVIPAAIWTGIGLSYTFTRIKQPALRNTVMIVGFILLTAAQISMLNDSVRNGPTWFKDYGLAGMQYGAQQVFKNAEEVATKPEINRVYVSSTWANGTDILLRFFHPDGGPVGIANAGPFLELMQPDGLSETIFVLTHSEYQDLLNNSKVGEVIIERIIDYPDGQPGFYFVQFNYSTEAQATFAMEQAKRQSVQSHRTEYRGIPLIIEYPYIDMGEIKHILDDDLFTLMRFYSANPATLSLTFNSPIELKGISVTTGSMDLKLTCRVYPTDAASPEEFSRRFIQLPDDPTVEIDFEKTFQAVSKIEIEIMALSVGDPFKIHLRDLTLK